MTAGYGEPPSGAVAAWPLPVAQQASCETVR
jgi:hypothetical protein